VTGDKTSCTKVFDSLRGDSAKNSKHMNCMTSSKKRLCKKFQTSESYVKFIAECTFATLDMARIFKSTTFKKLP
jgi:hypothetical protein